MKNFMILTGVLGMLFILGGVTYGNSERIEAEDANYNGAIFDKTHSGYSGNGFVDYQNKFGDYIQWTVYAHSAGRHSIAFRYALGTNEDRPLEIAVNGEIIKSSLSFPPTGGWNIWNTAGTTATLKKGYNKIRATAIGKSGANIDCIIVLK